MGREIRRQQKKKGRHQSITAVAFALLPLNSTKTNKAETTTRCRGFRAIVAHALLISRTDTLPHDLLFRFCINLQLYVSVRLLPPSPSPWFPLVTALGVLCCEALPAPLRLAPVPSRHEAVRRVGDPPGQIPTLLIRPRP